MTTELTIRDIAERYETSPTYAALLTQMKGFPEPEYTIGKNRMFDPKKVAKFFAERAKRKAK